MRAKEYLLEIKKIDAKINMDVELLAQYEALAEKRTAVLGGERVQTSASKGSMERYAVESVCLKEKINTEIDELVAYKEDARKLIQSACDTDCMKVLTKRYIGELNEETQEVEYLTWEKIAVDMRRSYKNVVNDLHKRALEQLQKKIDEREKELCLK